MSDSRPPQIAIIGGGISGLAAAFTLQELQPNAAITLFEAADRLGGSLWTRQVDVPLPDGSNGTFVVEQGADSFLVDEPATLDFFRRAGIADDLIETNTEFRRAFVLHAGKLVPVPREFALLQPRRLRSLLSTPLLSLGGKVRAAREVFVPRRKAESEESLADFARRRFGAQTYERLIEPLVAGIFTADGEKLSLQAALPKFAALEREHGSLIRAAWKARKKRKANPSSSSESASLDTVSDAGGSGARYGLFLAPRAGMSSLVHGLAACLTKHDVQLDAPVTALCQTGQRWKLCWKNKNAEQQAEFDGVVLATSVSATAHVLSELDGPLASTLAEIPTASSVVVSLGFRREDVAHPLDGFGFVVPRVANRQLLAASFPSVKFPNRAPGGCVLIRAFLGGALHPDVIEYLDDRLREIAERELRDMLGIRGAPLFAHVARWANAMPQFHLGHLERVQKIQEALAQLPGLELAGNYLHGVGIPHCLRSGALAAQAVASQLAPRN